MRPLLGTVLLALIATLGAASIPAQKGTIELKTIIGNFEGKKLSMARKRFYLLPGGLAENAALLDRLKAAEIKSRDCYYTEQKASPQFICWLQAESCESTYCRKVRTEEVGQVPEFKAAYDATMKRPGMTAAFALDWLTTSLPPILSNGFYEERRKLADILLAGTKPVQSAMSDRGFRAWFTDIPLTLPADKKTQLFTITNLIPYEIGNKSYIWAFEKEIGAARQTVPLPAKESSTSKIFVRELKVCKTQPCTAK